MVVLLTEDILNYDPRKPIMIPVELDSKTGQSTVIVTTKHHLMNPHRSSESGYEPMFLCDFTGGLITSKHQVGLGGTIDVRQHGHLIFAVLLRVLGANRKHITKIFKKVKYLVERVCRVTFGDPGYSWIPKYGMADAADEIGDAMTDSFDECERLMCAPHIQRKLTSTGLGKLTDKSAIDDLVRDFNYLQRLGCKHFRWHSYKKFLYHWEHERKEVRFVEYWNETWDKYLFSRADSDPSIASDDNTIERKNLHLKTDLGENTHVYPVQLQRIGAYMHRDAVAHSRLRHGRAVYPFSFVPELTRDLWCEVQVC